MFTKLREPFGTAGLVVAIIALIAALGGGAYAATHYLGATASKSKGLTKAQVLALIKANAGTGPAGPQGPAGSPGTNGKDGENGKPGASVTGTNFSGNQHGCTEGGVEFSTPAGTTDACNGEQGETGFTETLPKGKTETGVFASRLAPQESAEEFDRGTASSFNIPLSEAPEHVAYVEAGEATPTGCLGSASSPGAKPGYLCLFVTLSFGNEEQTINGETGHGPPAVVAICDLGTAAKCGSNECKGESQVGPCVNLGNGATEADLGDESNPFVAGTTGFGLQWRALTKSQDPSFKVSIMEGTWAVTAAG